MDTERAERNREAREIASEYDLPDLAQFIRDDLLEAGIANRVKICRRKTGYQIRVYVSRGAGELAGSIAKQYTALIWNRHRQRFALNFIPAIFEWE